MKNIDRHISLFASLGERLEGFGGDAVSRAVIASAAKANPWFMESDIVEAVEAIRTRMLQPEILAEWLGRYPAERSVTKDVAVIMAGNIPLVGFSDLLCVIASGNRCHMKMSGKDSVLMGYIAGLLKDIAPDVPVFEYREGSAYDAVIATGSDNTNRYFRSAFSGIPSLLRGSRSSVAVLGGGESECVLKLLSRDIFRYSGLGCRNVSLIFIPRDYDIAMLGAAITPASKNINPSYLNNYRHNKALLSVKGEKFEDMGCFVMQERAGFPVNISSLNYCRYDSLEEVGGWLAANEDAVQCIVADLLSHPHMSVLSALSHPRAVPTGQAHGPYPWDYPDGRDVMDFLT